MTDLRSDVVEIAVPAVGRGTFARPGAVPRVAPPAPTVTVVVPTLNEARNLPYVFSRMPSCVTEIVLVDGHSTDGTVEAALGLWPETRVVTTDRRGKGAALAAGFAAARGEIIVMLDADLSADPAEIPRFVEALVQGADFAKGSRFARGGGSIDITPIRRAGNLGLSALVNAVHGTAYTDLCYGYNAFWTRCVPMLDVDCDGFEVETLINIRVCQHGLDVVEVPSYEFGRLHGASNLNAVRDGLRVLRTIVRERARALPAAA